MKYWFISETPRVAVERAAIDALSDGAGWFSFERWRFLDGRLCAEGVIRVQTEDYPVRLVYPDQFPQVPAWVEPQDPNAHWSSHQYGSGGVLCLELRPDNWHESATGADVLASAFRLLEIENPLGNAEARARAPTAHRVGATQLYGVLSNPVFISESCLGRLRTTSASEVKAGYSALLDGVLPMFVHDGVDRTSAQYPPTSSQGFRELPVFLSAEAAPEKPESRSALRASARFGAVEDADLAGLDPALVFFVGGAEVVGFLVTGDGAPLRLQTVPLPETSGARSGRLSDPQKRVAVVGCGSVGSKVAECLVRSGVSSLTLVDGDVMLPANLERHTLDWRDVGYRKAHALKRRLLSIVPGANVNEVASNLSWQRSARTHAWQVEAIAGCDVIVDATGDVPTTLFLGAVAAANARPFVSIEVFEGGIGALVATCMPQRNPPYSRARTAFLAWCESAGVAPPEGTGRPYEALSNEGTIVADDAAVTIAAGHGARTVLDILDGTPPAAEAAWVLHGFRKGWVFDGHGHTIRMSVGAAVEDGAAHVDADALAFVSAVLEEWAGEPRSPA